MTEDEMSRVLFVGASGKVGRLVMNHWRASPPFGIEIIEQHRDCDRKTGFFWSLLDSSAGCLEGLRVDAIICLAGVTPSNGGDLMLNWRLAEAVLRSAHRAKIGRVLIASSSAVYGAGGQFSEADAVAPINPYGAAKLQMEQVCSPWRRAGVEICCLRIGNVAGADALLQNVVNATADTPLLIDRFADGCGPVRSYIGVGTLAEVMANLATHPRPLPQILNIAAPRVVRMENLARAAGQPYEFRPAPESAHQRVTLDCRLLLALHTFAVDASDPGQMVAQWKDAMYL